MCVLNHLDRFHLVADVIDFVPHLAVRAAYAKQAIQNKLLDHKEYISRTRLPHRPKFVSALLEPFEKAQNGNGQALQKVGMDAVGVAVVGAGAAACGRMRPGSFLIRVRMWRAQSGDGGTPGNDIATH